VKTKAANDAGKSLNIDHRVIGDACTDKAFSDRRT
jgi:hypothetical protein